MDNNWLAKRIVANADNMRKVQDYPRDFTPPQEVRLAKRKEQDKRDNIIRLRGYDKTGYTYELEVQAVPKDQKFREFIFDHPKINLFSLDSISQQVIKLRHDQHYFGDDFVYVPKHLSARRVLLSYMEQEEMESRLQLEAEEDEVLWVGRIDADSPTHELLENANSRMFALSTHPVTEDKVKTASARANNDPDRLDDYEIHYKPYFNCRRWDCPSSLCDPIGLFLDKWKESNKLTEDYVLVGTQLDSREAKEFDELYALREAAKDSLDLMLSGDVSWADTIDDDEELDGEEDE